MSQYLTLEYEVDDALADRTAALAIGPMPGGDQPTPLAVAKFLVMVAGAIVIMVVTGIMWNLDWWVIFPGPLVAAALVLPFGLWGLLHLVRFIGYRRVRGALLGPFRDLPHRRVTWAFTERGFTFESARRTLRAEWADLTLLQVAPGYQTLRLRTGEDVSIPGPVLTPAVADLVRRKAAVYGAKVQTFGKTT